MEEECLKLLALHQPVAMDLRFIVAVLKINCDLESIGDMAVNIAEHAAFLAEQDEVDIFYFPVMVQKSRSMFRNCVQALIEMNTALAHEVCMADDEVDNLHKNMYDNVKAAVIKNPDSIDFMIHLLSISRYMERIADHATNIAEDVIYMVEGEITRLNPHLA